MALASPAGGQTVTHRWSFSQTGSATNGTPLPDSLGGAPAIIRGSGSALGGGSITLPGNSDGNAAPAAVSGYIDLPNGIVSANPDLTVELWGTVRSAETWQRMIDFGRMNTSGTGEVTGTEAAGPGVTLSQDSLFFAPNQGTNLNAQRFSLRKGGAAESNADGSRSIALNTEFHFVGTYQAGVGTAGAGGGRLNWYFNGSLAGTKDVPYRLGDLEDVNNWLGRSQYSRDQGAHISYNEFRLYDYALSQAQVVASGAAGPDASFPAPVAAADSVTMHRGQKARIDVLDNDSGEINRSTLAIAQPPSAGSASVTGDGKILYQQTSGAPASDSFTYSISNSTGQSAIGTVSVIFAETLRLANPDLNVPTDPPATSLSLVDALPGLAFDQPLCLRTPPGETNRLFVCEKTGKLKVVPDVTAANPTASTVLTLSVNTSSESGLLSVAFHPNFAQNGYLYVFYSHSAGGLHQRVSRFTVNPASPTPTATNELILIDQQDDAGNHNGGDMHFGPDGFLYISVGDEGNGNDSLNNSQRVDKDIFSAILRIDVDKTSPLQPNPHPSIPTDAGVARFTIPVDNPFVLPANGGSWNGTYNGGAIDPAKVHREFYATGLRNPWRFSFDTATGELWVGDVGQNAREEVDLIQKGGNYGWAYREGNINGPKAAQAPANFNSLYYSPPIYDYDRSTPNLSGNSITGGVVYRGSRIASLVGKYIFGDYGSGNIWSLERNGANPPTIVRIAGEGGIAAFGADPSNGDILLADIDGSRILRLVSTPVTGDFPATLSATHLFSDLTDLSPAPGLLPYSVNLPFWSDGAQKTRWFIVPDGISKFGWSQNDPWTLPQGTIWVKHFDMILNRNAPAGDPMVAKRIETRLIVRNAAGVYGVSYRWNEAGTEAYLAADSGEDFTIPITDGGAPAPQIWHIPSRAECLTCHTPQAGYALSFNTRQLNLTNPIFGYPGNQLEILRDNSFFSGLQPGSSNLLPRHLRPDETQFSEEARVRSYLAVNCAYCHRPGGTAPTAWDGRPEIPLAQTGLINGSVASNNGDPLNRLVVPGSTPHSVLLKRIAATDGFSRMPPLATNVLDQTAINLVTSWIGNGLADYQTYNDWSDSKFGPGSPDGGPGQDPDRDGASNAAEYIAGTNPSDGASALRPAVSLTGNSVSVDFTLPANRSFTIESSENLRQWSPWDVPGNQGLPVAGGVVGIEAPRTSGATFFRVLLREN